MRRRLASLLLATAALLTAVGGPLDALQWVAWSGMLWQRSADQGVSAAVASTFDGEHPCPLCCAVREAREHQPDEPQAPASRNPLPSLPLALWRDPAPRWWLNLARPATPTFPAPALDRGALPAAPPVPPPRCG